MPRVRRAPTPFEAETTRRLAVLIEAAGGTAAVAGRLGVSARTVRYWLEGGRYPDRLDFPAIVAAIVPPGVDWRLEFFPPLPPRPLEAPQKIPEEKTGTK